MVFELVWPELIQEVQAMAAREYPIISSIHIMAQIGCPKFPSDLRIGREITNLHLDFSFFGDSSVKGGVHSMVFFLQERLL